MQKAIIFDYNRTLFNPESGVLFFGVKEILEHYQEKKYTLFLVAKGDKERKEQIKSLGLNAYFKKIIVNPEKTKSDFEECMKACEEEVEFYVVGDRIKREILFGNQCGMKTIWLKRGKFKNETPEKIEEEAHYIISSIQEIKKIIN